METSRLVRFGFIFELAQDKLAAATSRLYLHSLCMAPPDSKSPARGYWADRALRGYATLVPTNAADPLPSALGLGFLRM